MAGKQIFLLFAQEKVFLWYVQLQGCNSSLLSFTLSLTQLKEAWRLSLNANNFNSFKIAVWGTAEDCVWPFFLLNPYTWGCRDLAHRHPGGIPDWRDVAQLEQQSESREAKESGTENFSQVIIDKPTHFLAQLKSAPSRCTP